MQSYHINPETGNPNKCRAKTPATCRFKPKDGEPPPHYKTSEEAQAAYEKMQKNSTATPLLKRTAKKDTPSHSAAQKPIEAPTATDYPFEENGQGVFFVPERYYFSPSLSRKLQDTTDQFVLDQFGWKNRFGGAPYSPPYVMSNERVELWDHEAPEGTSYHSKDEHTTNYLDAEEIYVYKVPNQHHLEQSESDASYEDVGELARAQAYSQSIQRSYASVNTEALAQAGARVHETYFLTTPTQEGPATVMVQPNLRTGDYRRPKAQEVKALKRRLTQAGPEATEGLDLSKLSQDSCWVSLKDDTMVLTDCLRNEEG